MIDTATTDTLAANARLVRSKNAGPFWLTIDIFFHTDADYLAYHQQITAAKIAVIYGVEESTIKVFGIPSLRVTKISFPRSVTQGSPLDRDMHAGQQHVPLLMAPLFRAAATTPAEVAAEPDQMDTIAL